MSNLPLAEFKELCKTQYQHSVRQGFWTTTSDPSVRDMNNPDKTPIMDFDLLIGAKLGLVCTEVAEATEEYRVNGASPHFAEELADVIIRVMDIAGFFDIDLGEAIRLKLEKNKSRPYRHGKRF